MFSASLVNDLAFKTIQMRVQAILKKVALRPFIFIYHKYVTSKVWFNGDIGDFINYCVIETMNKIFGVSIVYQTGKPSLLTMLKDGYFKNPYERFSPLK